MTITQLRKAVSGKVRRLRQERRWTQARLAKLLGISQNRLSELERGGGSFSAEQLLVLLRTFNVPADFFYPSKQAEESQLQNALARLGASHLLESEVLPSDRHKEAADVILEVLTTAESPRHITGLAPVLVAYIHNLNLNRLRGRLTEAGLERRLGWVVENTVEALRRELEGDLPRDRRGKYRRARVALGLFLAPWLEGIGRRKAADDLLDADILTEETARQVREESGEVSRRWGIISRIRTEDFVQALREARGSG